ncbi:RNA-binding domain-containing protein [Youngiibacter fragilis]|uniref:ATPase AAA n=1 Tax=Youngiibacter fragilis 232.1 TaxID=994573 RepID=V7I4V6_9CLOT|nr:RNA-binding domain-containing protein [Youngiibacter fragilis]ETA80918.1 ATPase AAA [Youngiibacter fragilis 232.1]
MEILMAGETRQIEYKQNYSNTLLKTVSAFANYHDGHIILGISDDLHIIGVDSPDELRLTLENAINDNLDPKPYYEIEKILYDGKNIVVLKVYKGENTPYLYKNKAYKRMDTSTVAVDRFAYEELILQGRNTSFEELVSATQDLNFAFLSRAIKKGLGIQILTEDLLITLGLKRTGKYNNAAVILSDGDNQVNKMINLIAYSNDNVVEIRDRQTLSGMSVLEQFDVCMDFYRKHINVGEVITSAFRETVEEVPLVAYREAVANMIVHRDYSRDAAARIEIYTDRIEIFSPGGLPIGISEEEYLEGRISVSRNRVIADVFYRLRIIEKLATGVRRIKAYYKDSAKKPEFHVSENSITVVLPKISGNTADSDKGFISRLDSMSEVAKEIYEVISNKGPISRADIEKEIKLGKSQTIFWITQLRDKRLIIQLGRGRNVTYQARE